MRRKEAIVSSPDDIRASLAMMERYHRLMDGTPRSRIDDETLDALVAHGLAVKHLCWCDITPAGRDYLTRADSTE